ncbi:hypothetical protein MSP8887_02325 [Marinomonas spartinae]|uniref:hypothetical protein n=1 Tax=Marinomonas spartinae TaxID=1792290 RepID=UPI000808F338|nr:hypothetical protein [Marinomonas spartinae]SBS35178.1 hypothetical protein MSP8887_02325 [Marinomonas spartinae]
MLDYLYKSFRFLPIEPGVLKSGLETYLSEQRDWCESSDFSALFPFKALGLPQDFFLQKIIHCDGVDYLTGPRFLNGNIEAPYIELAASSGPLTSKAAEQIFKLWEPLQAKRIRVLRPAKAKGKGIRDQGFYACSLPAKAVQDNNVDDASTTQVVLKTALMSDLHWCLNALDVSYQEAYRRMPQLKDRLSPTDKDYLQELIEMDSVMIIMQGQTKVGLMAYEESLREFIQAYWMIEKAILPDYQGQHLSSKAQMLLCQQLTHNTEDRVLMGHIDSDNIPSIKTAELGGRERILDYVFLSREDVV